MLHLLRDFSSASSKVNVPKIILAPPTGNFSYPIWNYFFRKIHAHFFTQTRLLIKLPHPCTNFSPAPLKVNAPKILLAPPTGNFLFHPILNYFFKKKTRPLFSQTRPLINLSHPSKNFIPAHLKVNAPKIVLAPSTDKNFFFRYKYSNKTIY